MFNESSTIVIKHSELQFDKELGKGGFGVVYRGTWRHTDVAVKQLLMDNISPEAAEEFNKEAKMMANLRHDNIVSFRGYCVSPHYCIVMEYMPNGSLFHVLHSNKPLDWPIRFSIAVDMAKGLSFLHYKNIHHRDIKSMNVLLDERMRAKLSDFGLSIVKTETRSYAVATKTNNKDSVGTVQWMAPELLKLKANHTKKSDIYSLGITFWELAARKIPFFRENTSVIIDEVKKGTREDIPEDCPKEVAELIKACWAGEPEKRPDIDTVVVKLKATKENLANTETDNIPNYENNLHSIVNSSPQYRNNFSSESPIQPRTGSFDSKRNLVQVVHEKNIEIPSTTIMSMGLKETLALAKQGDARAQFRMGFFCINGIGLLKNEAKAVEWYEKSAQQGNGCALAALGSMYETGVGGLQKDSKKILKYYQDAFENLMLTSDDVFCQNSLGTIYLYGRGVVKNEEQAFMWYEKAAQQGNVGAQIQLGNMYLNGQGVAKNEKQAFFWYEKAAQQGDAEAQAQLGNMYLNAEGVTKDEKQAFNWFTKAAQGGDMEAQFFLGTLYENGQGVTKDERQAAIWYEKAAQQGDAGAQAQLGTMYLNAQGVTKDEKQAFNWFTKAAQGGDREAQFFLGTLYDNGSKVAKDIKRAFMWYEKAAQQEHMLAQFNLGVLYENGQGTAKDIGQAIIWYEKSAKQGYIKAQYVIGERYQHGQGVTKDIRQACQWYEKAAEQGDVGAQAQLQALYSQGIAPVNPLIFSPITPFSEVSIFLKLVVEGEQDKAEEYLKKNSELAFISGDVTDLSGRIFKDITGFQYAVWALDWHMWSMIKKYMSDDDIREQLQSMRTGTWVGQYEQSVNWQNLVVALNEQVKLISASRWDNAAQQWQTVVGGAQRLLPAHVVNQYCHPSRSFNPCPDFKVMPLPRARQTESGDWFTATYTGNWLERKLEMGDRKLGEKFAFLRGSWDKVTVLSHVDGGTIWQMRRDTLVAQDLKACHTLLVTRTQQRDELLAHYFNRPKEGIKY